MIDWNRLVKNPLSIKHPIPRKSLSLVRQLPRALKRALVEPEDFGLSPPVIANSFPKSGTNLLIQILEVLPGLVCYGSFVASMPSITFKERSHQTHLRLIRHIVPGELVGAHLFYDPLYHAKLVGKNSVHFFVYRDPRDNVISEAHYLTFMNRWHRMHNYYANRLTCMDERISTAILGVSEPGFPYDYPNIAERFSRYRGWLEQPDVFAVKFEDLVSERRNETLRSIVAFFAKHCVAEFDIDEVTQRAVSNMNPKSSPTFRKGRVGGWREGFSDKHKAHIKMVAGELLVQLGYEQDQNW